MDEVKTYRGTKGFDLISYILSCLKSGFYMQVATDISICSCLSSFCFGGGKSATNYRDLWLHFFSRDVLNRSNVLHCK